jgi:hypothetical protein
MDIGIDPPIPTVCACCHTPLPPSSTFEHARKGGHAVHAAAGAVVNEAFMEASFLLGIKVSRREPMLNTSLCGTRPHNQIRKGLGILLVCGKGLLKYGMQL